MLPMIDVIFLLLTFFIYSMVMMVRADVLPVQLVPVRSGTQAQPADIAAVTIDRAGRYYLNREPVSPDELDQRLAELAQRDQPPKLFLAMEEAAGTDAADAGGDEPVDRGPLLIGLIEQVRAAGLTDFSVVGPRQ